MKQSHFETIVRTESEPHEARGGQGAGRFIYIATPWGARGGGMYKVADYLIQQQEVRDGFAQLRPLDTRGGGGPLGSILYLMRAMWRILMGRVSGRLVGVHVQMAERLSVARKGVLVLFARAIGLPVVIHLHAAQLHLFYRALPASLRWTVRWVFSAAGLSIVLGPAARKFLVEEVGVAAEKVTIVFNGVPGPSVARESSRDDEDRRILFLGNLSERKGVSDLLHALARPAVLAQRWVVELAGAGDIDHYRALAESLGIGERVRFLGWVDQKTAGQHLARADLLILPSYDEGLPLVILEALANAVPVIATPVGEIGHVLVDGQDALLVEPGAVPAIGDALVSLLADRALRERIGESGRRLYQQKFSLGVFFSEVAAVHRHVFGMSAASKPDPGPGRRRE